MIVSRHAKDRIKERMGLPKRASVRLCSDALCHGLQAHESPFPVANWMRKHERSGYNTLFYRDFCFIFVAGKPICVTVIDMSEHLQAS